MKVLLVNPWITDFSAFDFWIRPLGLLYAGAALAERGHSVGLIDCLDRYQESGGYEINGEERKFHTGKFIRAYIDKPLIFSKIPRKYSRYGMPHAFFEEKLTKSFVPDVVLVTCMMTYWYEGAFQAIAAVRRMFGDVPVILGGVYSALCPEHALKSGADVIIGAASPGRVVRAVESLTGKPGNGRITPDEFDSWPEPLWELYRDLPSAVVTTTRGCPMRCTVCASWALFPGFERKNPLKAAENIIALSQRGVRDCAFYDDALLIDPESHAIPLFRKIAEAGAPLRLHTPNGLHVREITPFLAKLMRDAGVVTIRLSLETSSEKRGGDFSGKITRDGFEKAAANLYGAGYGSENLGAYIMAGLPGQTREEVYETAEFSGSCGIPVKPALFSPVPGTVEYMKSRDANMADPDEDPLFHNNILRTVDFWEGGVKGYTEFQRFVETLNKNIDSPST